MHLQSDCQTHYRGNQGGPPRPPFSFADPPPREGCNGDAGGDDETSGGDVQMIDVVDHRRVKGIELFFGHAVQGLDASSKPVPIKLRIKKTTAYPIKPSDAIIIRAEPVRTAELSCAMLSSPFSHCSLGHAVESFACHSAICCPIY